MIKTFSEYYHGWRDGDQSHPGYAELVSDLVEHFRIGDSIVEENEKKDFIRLYEAIGKLKEILLSFDEFSGNEILPECDAQDYRRMYENLCKASHENNNTNDDIHNG